MTEQPRVAPDGRGLAFILSAPRAGSTLLAAILGSHSEVLCPPEPWLLLPLVKLLDGELLVVGSYDHSLAAQAIAELASRAVQDEAVRLYAYAVYNSLLHEASKQVFVDKTPRYYQISDRLSELFPRALQIWLKRNPLDVIASLKSTWGLSVSELVGEHLSPYTFDAMISHGLLAEHFRRTTTPIVEMKYEDLVADPQQHVIPICDALGITFEPEMLEYGRNARLVDSYKRAQMGDKKLLSANAAHPGSIDRWRTVLEPADVALCLEALGLDTLRDAGYDEVAEQACAFAGLSLETVSRKGRVAAVRQAYEEYSGQVMIHAEIPPRSDAPSGLKYTLLGQQNELLQREAERRLEVIQRLDADVRVLRERAQLANALRAIEAAMATHRSALEQVEAAVGRQQESLSKIESAVARHELTIAEMARAVSSRTENGSETHIDQAWYAERRALQLSREQAEAAAEARLHVIEEQERALRRYRRWHPTDHVARLIAPRIGQLYQYAPRALHVPNGYFRIPKLKSTPTISIVTPSLNQGRFIERTIRSVLDQRYPAVEYIVKDAGSRDETVTVLERHRDALAQVVCGDDSGFANGINQGFEYATGEIMAYLNSDDILLPGSLHYVAKYFTEHQDIDVVYGHRILIDEYDSEIGRWVLPRHDDDVLSWADYVPQETLFWRRRVWERVGGKLDENFRFAVDWDLLLRFRDTGAVMRRLPRFIGAFRVHPHQKTSSLMEDVGKTEMDRLRTRCHGRPVVPLEIEAGLRKYLRQHFYYHKLYRLGLLRY
jgi:glycosyltransferase involved in cell wall biosynthesis